MYQSGMKRGAAKVMIIGSGKIKHVGRRIK